MKKTILFLVFTAFSAPQVLAEEQPSEKEQECRTEAAMNWQTQMHACQKKKGAAQKKCDAANDKALSDAVEKCKAAK